MGPTLGLQPKMTVVMSEQELSRPCRMTSYRRASAHAVKYEVPENDSVSVTCGTGRSNHVRASDRVCNYVARLWSYASAAMRESESWGVSTHRAIGAMHMALYDWEALNDFTVSAWSSHLISLSLPNKYIGGRSGSSPAHF